VRILQFLHSHGVVWGDLKPQNLVLFGSSGSVSILKAVDLDSSVILSNHCNIAFGGNNPLTSHYGSPERVKAAFSKRDDKYGHLVFRNSRLLVGKEWEDVLF